MTDHSVEINEQLSIMIILELSLFNDVYLNSALSDFFKFCLCCISWTYTEYINPKLYSMHHTKLLFQTIFNIYTYFMLFSEFGKPHDFYCYMSVVFCVSPVT